MARLIFSITLLFSILPLVCGCTDYGQPPKKTPAATDHAEGKRLFNEGRYKEAIEHWSKELEISPRDANVLNNIGIAHHELGNDETALEYHNKALAINPQFAHPYYSRGRAYLSQNHFDLAESDFKKAIELKWNPPSAYYNLLVVYRKKKDCKKAELAFGKLRELRRFVKEGELELIGCYLSSGRGDKAVELLAQGLKSNDPGARGYAIRKLGETKHPSAVDLLIGVLIREHSYPAAYALADIGAPAIKPLETALRSGDREVRRVVLTALDKIISDPRATDSLILGLRDEDPGLRSLSASALGRKQDPRALGPLGEALKDEDPNVRKWAVKSLGEIKNTGRHPVEAIFPILKDGNKDVRVSTIETLGKLQDVRAVQPLIEILKENDVEFRMRATTALGQIRNEGAVEPLLALIKTEDPRLRMSSVDALGEIGDARAVEPLIALLGDQDVTIRQRAAKALGKTGDLRSVEPLIRTLKKDVWVMPWAAEALGEIRDLHAVEPLIAALQIHHPIREYFNRRLESSFPSHGEGSVVAFLVMAPFASVFRDNAPNIRESACRALGRVKDPRAVEPLIEALKDRESMVRKGAADALVEINDPKTPDYLAPLLKHEDSETRESATKVMKRLTEGTANR